jgi:hypothetical protein
VAETKLNYRFHNLNPADVSAEHILRILIEANMPKVEAAIRAAREQANADAVITAERDGPAE